MTSSLPQPSPSAHITLPSVPPLQNGDRLIRPEFERRYFTMPEIRIKRTSIQRFALL